MRVVALLLTLAIIAFQSVIVRAEDTWRGITNNAFSFSVPSNFKKTDQCGIDSFVEEYIGDGIDLEFDYGWYSNNFQGWPKETKFEKMKIDGKIAKLGTVKHESRKGLPYSTQIYIKLSNTNTTALSMFAACRSEKEVAQAKKIFETITFKRK